MPQDVSTTAKASQNGSAAPSEYPVISADPGVQAEYVKMRRDGQSHNMAEMLALQRPPTPGLDDTVFMRGNCNGNQFVGCESEGNDYRAMAKQAGVSITGKRYVSGLANFPGDPRAWVGSINEAKQVCKDRGWDCKVKDGALQVQTGGNSGVNYRRKEKAAKKKAMRGRKN